MSVFTISERDLGAFVAGLMAGGTEVIGPARGAYKRLETADELDLGATQPARSVKEAFLPRTEVLVRWRRNKGDAGVELIPPNPGPERRVVIGARPCDAAGVAVLDGVMGWGSEDDLWFARRRSTVVIGLACAGESSARDASCFCTTVGLSPTSRRGSDLLLVRTRGGYLAETVTPAGEQLVAEAGGKFVAAAEDMPADAAPASVDTKAVAAWLEQHFDHPMWQEIALRCHGCGACASVCPTCHCFDIVDEPEGIGGGVRRRNWDTCQTAKFTLHASGHNPRGDQNVRFRQRVLHKFWIYPTRFGEVLCTGCGRCVRVCPGGMDLPEVLGKIDEAVRS